MDIKQLIHTLQHTHQLQPEQMQTLLTAAFSDAVIRAELAQAAQQTAQAVFGNKIYIRGLIEFTNYCRNDCYYCGIRRSNTEAVRYRLTEEQILSCCEQGYALGFRTFVLQGGEDLIYSDTDLAAIISAIKQAYPDCAVTLSIGERRREAYQLWKKQAQTVICCATKQRIANIMHDCTRQNSN